MWIVFAVFSAVFAGITSILAKCGIKDTPSNVATAVRTGVVLVFSWLMVFIVGSQNSLGAITVKSWIFLILSGLATGASWLCYFKALQKGDVNKVVPVDKSSTVLTIVFSFLFLNEQITAAKAAGVVLIAVGTFLTVLNKRTKTVCLAEDCAPELSAAKDGAVSQEVGVKPKREYSWLIYALLSAIFASLTAILGKAGISEAESNLGTAIRTGVVLVMAWAVVFAAGQQKHVKEISKKELLFICLSGIATGVSWLCYFKALQDGVTSAVVAIDKLSVIITIVFSFVVFKEKPSLHTVFGLILFVLGTAALLL